MKTPKVGKVKTGKQIINHVTAPMSGQFLKSRSAWTYTAIALPGILLGISGIQRLLRHIVSKCYPGQIQWCIRGTSNTISLVLDVLFCVTLIFAAEWNREWTNERLFVYVHNVAVKVLAYLSATFIIGVKFLGPRARNKSSHPQSDRYGEQIRGLPPTLTCCEYLPEFHNWHICGLSRGCHR